MNFIQLRGYQIITMFWRWTCSPAGEGGGGRGTVYASAASDSGTGYKNHCFPVEVGIFYFRLTLENRAVLLSSTPCYPPSSSNALQSKNLMQADNKQMRDNKNL